MLRLTRLKKEAMESCKFRNHNMTKFITLCEDTYVSNCKKCGKSVTVNLNPMPNDTEIGGEAVALNCIGFGRLSYYLESLRTKNYNEKIREGKYLC